MSARRALAALAVAAFGSGCDSAASAYEPHLAVRAEHKALILERIGREPYATLYQRVLDRAARDYREGPDPMIWDTSANIENATTTQANAFLAWLNDDQVAGAKARELLARLSTDINSNSAWDLNIRMPDVLFGYCNAWDLLMAAGQLPPAEAEAAADKITEITHTLFARYLLNNANRVIALGVSQNNHPIRTATAIGYPALLFPQHPEARTWLDWAVSELDYLWGPDGQYVQADGGVSEGPDYYRFAFGATVSFFVALSNSIEPSHTFLRDCRNRSPEDPWADNGCIDGEPFTFVAPLGSEAFQATAAWSIALRLPNGYRPPFEDARFSALNGQAVLTGFGAPGYFRWDWQSLADGQLYTEPSADLTIHHLAYMDDAVPASPPPWTSRVLPAAGNAVFRSGWDQDAVWVFLIAEHGSVRKTLHDHVDSTSFTMAAYGEYLLLDSGYYKPYELDNARTAQATSHNVILIDGEGAPRKGLLTDFGDADAFLENTIAGRTFEYAEARQSYRDTDIRRSVVFVGGRYAVVADRLDSTREPREYRWRLHGNAGFEAGGSFRIEADGGVWERPLAGVRQYLASTAGPVRLEAPPFVDLEAPYVDELARENMAGHHAVLDGVVTAAAPDFLAVLAPYRVGAAATDPAAPLAVEGLAVGRGRAAWLVTSAAGTDLVLLREPGTEESVSFGPDRTLRTDAELVVVAVDRGAALVARGTYVDLDGVRIASVDASSGVAIAEQ